MVSIQTALSSFWVLAWVPKDICLSWYKHVCTVGPQAFSFSSPEPGGCLLVEGSSQTQPVIQQRLYPFSPAFTLTHTPTWELSYLRLSFLANAVKP